MLLDPRHGKVVAPNLTNACSQIWAKALCLSMCSRKISDPCEGCPADARRDGQRCQGS